MKRRLEISSVWAELRQCHHELSRYSTPASRAFPEYLARRSEDQTLLGAADGWADTLFETRGVCREFPVAPQSCGRGSPAYEPSRNPPERRAGFVLGGGGGQGNVWEKFPSQRASRLYLHL